MKKLAVLIPLMIFSCAKKESNSKMATKESIQINHQPDLENRNDSSSEGVLVRSDTALDKKEILKNVRIINGNSIIKTIDGDMIPLTINDEFTTDRQKLILKIKNFKGKKIVAKISAKSSNMNIRFNQIKFADGSFDGPFGIDISEEINQPGEIWLIIGKNLMADGQRIGKFSISLK